MLRAEEEASAEATAASPSRLTAAVDAYLKRHAASNDSLDVYFKKNPPVGVTIAVNAYLERHAASSVAEEAEAEASLPALRDEESSSDDEQERSDSDDDGLYL